MRSLVASNDRVVVYIGRLGDIDGVRQVDWASPTDGISLFIVNLIKFHLRSGRTTSVNRRLVQTPVPRGRDDRYDGRQVSTLWVASDRLAMFCGELRFRLPDKPPIHEARREHEPINSGTYTGHACQSSKRLLLVGAGPQS